MFASHLTSIGGTAKSIGVPTRNTKTSMGRVESLPSCTEDGIMYFTSVFSHGFSTFSIISLISLGLILPDSNISLSILYISLA